MRTETLFLVSIAFEGRRRDWYSRRRPCPASLKRQRGVNRTTGRAFQSITRSAGGVVVQWFRFYNEVMHDPKVQNLNPELFRFWVNLLCLASAAKDRGTLPPISDIAFTLRVRRDRVERFITALRACELLVTGPNNALQPHNWAARQPESDNIAKRVRDHRQRTSERRNDSDVTLPPSPRNVTVTPSRARDSDTDTEEAAPIRAGARAREAGADPAAAAPPPPAPPTGTPTAPAPPPAPAPGPTTPAAPPPPAVPPYPDERGPLDIHTGPHELTRAEAEAIWGLLWRTWPDAPRLANGWYEHQRWFPADRWRAAIREAHRRGETPGSVKFLERLAGDPKVGAAEAGPPPVHANGRRPAAAPVYFTAPPGHEKRPRRSDGPPPPLLPPRAPDVRPDPGPKGLEP